MGRLATNIAAAAADADNMPPTDKLPSVSLIDALLPRRLASIGSSSSKEKVSRLHLTCEQLAAAFMSRRNHVKAHPLASLTTPPELHTISTRSQRPRQISNVDI